MPLGIRRHAGNLEAVVEACWVVHYLFVFIDGDPQHHYSSKGQGSNVTSWCFYQRAIVLDQDWLHHLDDDDKNRLIPLHLAENV